MKFKTGQRRWQIAQKLELIDWRDKNITADELEEIKVKYHQVLKQISGEIGFKSNWQVLDLGCGPTCISRFLPPAKKVGVDPLASKLGIAGKKIAGVKVFAGRGEKIPFAEKRFDLVICRNALDHAQNPDKMIEEVSRVLKPQRYFILACYVYPRCIVWLKRFSELVKAWRNLEHPFAFTQEDLKELGQKYFKVVKGKIIFEGKHSTDFGKIARVEPDKSIINKLIIFINRQILGSSWFVREYLLLLQLR